MKQEKIDIKFKVIYYNFIFMIIKIFSILRNIKNYY